MPDMAPAVADPSSSDAPPPRGRGTAPPSGQPTRIELWLALLALVALGAAVTAAYRGIACDDVFITYRYAHNLAAGRGLVYNPGQRFLGTTAPLYALLLGLLSWHHPDRVPQIGAALSGLSLTLTGAALLYLGRRAGPAACGLLAGLLYVVNPIADWAFGGETLPQVALIAWAFVSYRRGRGAATVALLAAAVLTRPDALAAAAAVGAHAALVRRRPPWRGALGLALLLLPFPLACHAYYGVFLPDTLAAKIAQMRSGDWPGFWAGGLGWLQDVAGHLPGGHALGLLAVLGVSFVLRARLRRAADPDGPAVDVRLSGGRFGFWLLPLAWVALYVVGYVSLGLPFYFWYLVPVALGLCALAAAGAVGLVGLLADRLTPRSRLRAAMTVAGIAVVAGLLGAQLAYARRFARAESAVDAYRGRGPDTIPRVPLYRALGQWLARNTPPGSSVGAIEVGALGYYSERVLVDPLGLVTPGAVPHVAGRDFTWAYRQDRPDFLVDNPDFDWALGDMRTAPWFVQEYRFWAQVPRAGAAPVTIYRRVR